MNPDDESTTERRARALLVRITSYRYLKEKGWVEEAIAFLRGIHHRWRNTLNHVTSAELDAGGSLMRYDAV